MPIYWRYLLNQYLKVLILTVFSFLTILIVTRLEEIAHFAILGASIRYVILFVLYQIPYILPIAIPISCLLSSLLLFQRFSHTGELTSLRASGLSLFKVMAPILMASCLIAQLSFYITSELATSSRLATRKMIYELTSTNPLILLQSAKIASLKGAYVQFDPVRNGKQANNLIMGMYNRASERLNLCLVKEIYMEDSDLLANQVSVVSSIPGDRADHLMIENQASMRAKAPDFAYMLRNKGWRIASDHLTLRLLQCRLADYKASDPLTPKILGKIQKCYSELVRRFALGIAPITFTLMGMVFGMEISRHASKRGILKALGFTGLTLILFFTAKELDHLFWIASALFLLPHLLILISVFFTLSRLNKGIE